MTCTPLPYGYGWVCTRGAAERQPPPPQLSFPLGHAFWGREDYPELCRVCRQPRKAHHPRDGGDRGRAS